MTDPLLTIDEATRAFRASPKTIRRRLVAGEIEGAYKRPGTRGPEWVMPEGGLIAAGFAPRRDAPPRELPDDPIGLAAYWERRALDAEASLRAGPPPAPARTRRFGTVLTVIGVLLLLLVLGLLASQIDGSDGDADRPETSTGVVRALLTAQTDEGERIGVVGAVPEGAVPEGRVAVEVAADADDGPRFVVAAVEDGETPPALDAVGGAGAVVLGLPTGGARRLQSLWSLAGQAIAADGDATEVTVGAYWSALMDANADRLVEPGNPNLLHVGQELVVPPWP